MPNSLHIPEDILVDILCQLPVKSILRFKAVGKSWKSLFSSHEFSLKHLRHHASDPACNHGVLQVRDSSLTVVEEFDYETPEYTFSEFLMPEVNGDYSSAEVMGSCNGLVLISLNVNRSEFILWNPYIKEYKKISRRISSSSCDLHYIAGLGYDKLNDNYKIIVGGFSKNRTDLSLEIYNLKKGVWVTGNYVFPYTFLRIIRSLFYKLAGTTTANGIPHWIARKRHGWRTVILSFDLADEILKEVAPPTNFMDFNCLSTMEGNLCAGSLLSDRVFVWVMKKSGTVKSWIKLNMDFSWPPFREEEHYGRIVFDMIPIGYAKDGNMLMALDRNQLVVVYDRVFGLIIDPIYDSTVKEGMGVVTFIESLISPNNYN